MQHVTVPAMLLANRRHAQNPPTNGGFEINNSVGDATAQFRVADPVVVGGTVANPGRVPIAGMLTARM